MAPTPREALVATIDRLAGDNLTGEVYDILLRDFRKPSRAARDIIALLEARGIADEETVEAFSSHGRQAMVAALARNGTDLPLFGCLLDTLLQGHTESPHRRAHALTCLFCALAESGDPHKAAANIVVRAYLASAEPPTQAPARAQALC